MLKRLWNGSHPLTATGFLMIGALGAAIVGLAIDPRVITGAPAWLKPAKFAVSIAIYTFTLAWIFSLIPEWARTRRVIGWATAAVMVLELAIIDLQAYRGTTSHFNVATPFDMALFATMGIAIFVQTLSTVAVAVALSRHRFEDRALGAALRFGMVITIVGAMSGGLMTRPTPAQLNAARAGQAMTVSGAHTVGAPDGGPGLPGTGWSTRHGDLRIAHFVGLHALQALPVVALVLKRRGAGDAGRTRLVRAAAFSYAALFVILLTQALRGQPVVAADAVTIALVAAWALATAAASLRATLAERITRTPVVV